MKAEARFADGILFLSGEFTAKELESSQKEALRIIAHERVSSIDASGITRIDNSGTVLFEEIVIRASQKQTITIIPPSPELQQIMDIFRLALSGQYQKPKMPGFLEKLGTAALDYFESFKAALFLASDIFYWSLIGIFNKRSQRKGSLTQNMILLGQNAVPIISLLSFIIGFILSLQAAVQLRIYGGGVFLADLVAISMFRELGPLLTAIIVAGRSGSAIASEIGSMKISEELDALRMMSLNPIRYVVVPKFHAITLVMPILVSFGILLGSLGGTLVAVSYLGISPENFFTRCVQVLTVKDLAVTYFKSWIFAWLVVIIGAHYGFRVSGGAEGVGKATTSSVVTSIFAVIIADSLFGLLYL
jgi:phospholipid/cholesterol/gamma-HCH transport system permease protein